jgi:hypothetical protein
VDQPRGHSLLFTIPINLHRHLSTDSPCPEAERLVTTANVTPKTTSSNSLLLNTASNYIQQHVNSANGGDVDKLVVFGVTFAVVTRRSASGHGESVLKCR